MEQLLKRTQMEVCWWQASPQLGLVCTRKAETYLSLPLLLLSISTAVRGFVSRTKEAFTGGILHRLTVIQRILQEDAENMYADAIRLLPI
jgi:hypothetical protein